MVRLLEDHACTRREMETTLKMSERQVSRYLGIVSTYWPVTSTVEDVLVQNRGNLAVYWIVRSVGRRHVG
jgi:hypothetical protein